VHLFIPLFDDTDSAQMMVGVHVADDNETQAGDEFVKLFWREGALKLAKCVLAGIKEHASPARHSQKCSRDIAVFGRQRRARTKRCDLHVFLRDRAGPLCNRVFVIVDRFVCACSVFKDLARHLLSGHLNVQRRDRFCRVDLDGWLELYNLASHCGLGVGDKRDLGIAFSAGLHAIDVVVSRYPVSLAIDMCEADSRRRCRVEGNIVRAVVR
jgi:hypothetical protein